MNETERTEQTLDEILKQKPGPLEIIAINLTIIARELSIIADALPKGEK